MFESKNHSDSINIVYF